MSINSIIIDNKTKAKRIASDKVQLDLVAMPLDKDNDMEPNVELRLYVNDQLLQNLKSSIDGYVKESFVISDKDGESITVKLEELTSNIQSKIKFVMINGLKPEKENIKSPEQNKQEIMKFVSERGWNLSDERCKEYINDFDVVMAAVQKDGLALQFVSDSMKVNYDIVMAAVKQNGLSLKYAHNSFRDNRDISLEALKQNVLAYNLLSEITFLDEEILGVVFNSCVKDISLFNKLVNLPSFQRKEFEKIINGDIDTFLKTSHAFVRNNKEIVLSLMQEGDYISIPEIFNHMGNNFKDDVEVIKKIIDNLADSSCLNKATVNYGSPVLNLFPDTIKNNENVMLYLFNKMKEKDNYRYKDNYHHFLQFVGKKLFDNENFILTIFPESCLIYTDTRWKEFDIVRYLLNIPECTLIQSKKFVLKLIKLSKKYPTDNYDVPYYIYKELCRVKSVLLQDEDFVLKIFDEIHPKSILAATIPENNGGFAYDKYTLRKIKTIMEEKKPDHIKSFMEYHKLNFATDFPKEYIKQQKKEKIKKEKEHKEILLKLKQEEKIEQDRREKLKKEYKVMIGNDTYDLNKFEKRTKNDKEIVLLFLNKNIANFKEVGELLKKDECFVLECIQTFGINIIKYFPNYTKDLPIVKSIIIKRNYPIKIEIQNLESEIRKLYDEAGELLRKANNKVFGSKKLYNNRNYILKTEIPEIRIKINNLKSMLI